MCPLSIFTDQHLSEIILFLTLLAICWYSLETRWLRQATIMGIELGHRPLIILDYIQPRVGSNPSLHATNIGRGCALSIHCTYKGSTKDKLDSLNAYLDKLQSGISSEFKSTFRDNDKDLPKLLDANLNAICSNNPATVTLKYSDVLGNNYQSVCDFDGTRLALQNTSQS